MHVCVCVLVCVCARVRTFPRVFARVYCAREHAHASAPACARLLTDARARACSAGNAFVSTGVLPAELERKLGVGGWAFTAHPHIDPHTDRLCGWAWQSVPGQSKIRIRLFEWDRCVRTRARPPAEAHTRACADARTRARTHTHTHTHT